MTASTAQPKIRRERRIIERPRLIKMLDECEARVILLLAPAGYGKTTLARQWAKTLNGAIWVSLTPAHRDVASFAEDVAAGIDALGGNAGRFVGEYLRSRSNPQRAARDIGVVLAEQLKKARVQWLVMDDYHEVSDSLELRELISVIEGRATARLLVATRLRPSWATQRRVLYGEIAEIGRDDLAMDEGESRLVLGRRPGLTPLVVQAEGWPAVLGLAATADSVRPPGSALPEELYSYFADELYQSLPETLRAQLLRLALVPELSEQAASEQLGADARNVIETAREIGFLSADQRAELHPLVRDFLLQKLAEDASAEDAVRRAIRACVECGRSDRAFELLLRFGLHDLVEPVLEAAYRPLVRSGRLGTLSEFIRNVRAGPAFAPPAVDLVEAELALRDGEYRLAADLAHRVSAQLPHEHALASRAHALAGQSAFSQGDLAQAELAYRLAHETARDDQDEAEALYGWAIAAIQGEVGDPAGVLSRLAERRHASPLDLIRHATAELARRRFGDNVAGSLGLEEPLHILARAEDPRARSSFAVSAAYVLALRSQYREALELSQLLRTEIEAFDLEFARPHSNTVLVLISLGLRRFGVAERCLQLVEDSISDRPLGVHVLNARILRIRLALQTGETDRTRALLRLPDNEMAIPSLHAEYLAAQALALAVDHSHDGAIASGEEAIRTSSAIEVRVMAEAARAVVGAQLQRVDECTALFETARQLGVWDPVIAALRSSPDLSALAATIDPLRPDLELLYERSNDRGLARRAGFRTRSTRAPHQILSPRELEVLGLLARGFRNRDIAAALVISESTTKVHVRHILEKLGVRSRAEAVARFELFDA